MIAADAYIIGLKTGNSNGRRRPAGRKIPTAVPAPIGALAY
jgi:hypothetical protein